MISRWRRWGAIASEPRPGWNGATFGLLVAVAVLVAWSTAQQLLPRTGWILVRGTAADLLVAAVAAALVTALAFVTIGRFRALSWRYLWAVLVALIVLLARGGGASARGWYVAVGVVIVGSSLAGAASGLLGADRRREPSAERPRRTVALAAGAALVLGVPGTWLALAGQDRTAVTDAGTVTAAAGGGSGEDLATAGPFTVGTLTYGSGTDERPEYGPGVDLSTSPVDASRLLEGWDDRRAQLWGFDEQHLPLNGQVWYPEDHDGRAPLVLLVHGNNTAVAASEDGLAYLGEHLASHGIIAAAVDQNFLSTGALDRSGGLSGVDATRGWLLLEHLAVWDAWSRDDTGPFGGKVDTGHVGLVGHSRGGEAIAVATHLHQLGHLPDDPSVTFDHDVDIAALLALAPSDGQYRLGGEAIELEDVDYLTIQGSHDADIRDFAGLHQYERVRFTGGEDRLKAALYVGGANHTQFNSDWGRHDVGYGLERTFLDVGALREPAEQRRIARGYATAFFGASLGGEDAHRHLLRDVRVGADWLPEGPYVSRSEDASRQLAVDLGTAYDGAAGELPPAVDTSGSVTVEPIRRPMRTGPSDDLVLRLAWEAEPDTAEVSFEVDGVAEGASHLVVDAVALTSEAASPGTVTVQVTDRSGDQARLPLTGEGPLAGLVDGQYLKARWMHGSAVHEPVLQTYRLDLADLQAVQHDLDLDALTEVSLRFDTDAAGAVLVDDIGFAAR